MSALIDLISQNRLVEGHRPWQRAIVDSNSWHFATRQLAKGDWTLLGLWGEASAVHMAVMENENALAVLSIECPQGKFPSVGKHHPPAIRLERAIGDLFGLAADGAPDTRVWLDHGKWDVRHPLGQKAPAQTVPYAFLPAEGESLHQIPVGPVHAGIIEPGHFRFTANGETVVRLEERLGYVHKGIEGLMSGADLARAAKLAGHVSGDSTVAYSIAFSRAVEVAVGIEAPPRAAWLRALMAELERIANHLGDIGAICNDASFSLMHAHCGALRELVLRAAQAAFGHRLMMDRIVPGGVTVELTSDATTQLQALLHELRQRFRSLINLYDDTASLQDRTSGSGVLTPALAKQFGAGGIVGRASARNFDARRNLAYPPYDQLTFDVPVLVDGDVDARVWARIKEFEQSLSLIEQILARLPDGPTRVEVPLRAGEGMALAEGFRGDVLAWVRLGGDGQVIRCHLRDPSWFHWPLLEAAIEGNIVADFPLINKSFNCSYSGHDL
jgi:Ni,Fe-hydrogenase III large subunit